MFQDLERINRRPEPFEIYSTRDLWTDEHTSARMLACHLDDTVDLSSRRSDFVDRSVAWMADRFGIGPGTRIADFGCGPGLYAQRLARRGGAVTGIDFSARSIEYARAEAAREGLAIRYENRDYLEFTADTAFDLAVMIMGDFSALSPDRRRRMLDIFAAALAPGGAVVLDVYSMALFDAREESASYAPNLLDGFWSAAPYYGFLNVFKYADARVCLDKYTIVEESRTREVYNWLQHFTPESLTAEFREAGFEIEQVLGDVAGADYDAKAPEFAVVARRG